jgi:hypothetical protein
LQSTGRSLHIHCLSEGGVQTVREVHATLNMTVNFSAGVVQSDASTEVVVLKPRNGTAIRGEHVYR